MKLGEFRDLPKIASKKESVWFRNRANESCDNMRALAVEKNAQGVRFEVGLLLLDSTEPNTKFDLIEIGSLALSPDARGKLMMPALSECFPIETRNKGKLVAARTIFYQINVNTKRLVAQCVLGNFNQSGCRIEES